MSTIVREWLGLHSAPTFPFKDLILNPKFTRLDHDITRRDCPLPLLKNIKQGHNSSQVWPQIHPLWP
jgi:hypothetical protein